MRTLILLLALIIVSCQDKAPNEVDAKFGKLLREMDTELDKIGSYEYSPDGKDSVWVKGFSKNPILMDSVITGFRKVERKWDSLLFLSKKYDSIPYPSPELLKRYQSKARLVEAEKGLKEAIERNIEAGILDKYGNKIEK